MRRRPDQRGSALVELTWLGVLLLVPVLWIVLTVFEVQKGAFATSGAARAAGRAYALAPDDATGRARAEASARRALADQGVEGQPLRLTVSCEPSPANCHESGSVVTVVVHSRVDVPMLPDLLGDGAPSISLDARHRVPIGQFREAG